MTYQHLTVEKENHIAVVTFDRPEQKNTLSVDLMEEICRLAADFGTDSETRTVIFTGAGAHFSAGLDLSDPKWAGLQGNTLLGQYRHMKLGPRMIQCLAEMDQITIAAVNGYALGGGACIATACDFRIGAGDCAVGYPEVGLAMNLSWAALPLCVHLIGPARTKQMVILAKRENAETLLKWGFLDEVVPAEALMAAAREMAARYAAQPPLAAQMVKRSVNAIVSALDRSVMHMDSDQFLYATSGEDFKEAIAALFEKREGKFTGA